MEKRFYFLIRIKKENGSIGFYCSSCLYDTFDLAKESCFELNQTLRFVGIHTCGYTIKSIKVHF